MMALQLTAVSIRSFVIQSAARSRTALLFVCAWLGTPSPGFSQQHTQAIRSTSTITLDGALDEPARAEAPVARNFIQNEPREGARHR